MIAGVDWVTGNHAAGQPAVANTSLDGGASTALDNAVRNSIADGVSYAIAAGNRERWRRRPERLQQLAGAGLPGNDRERHGQQ
jgi:hypothetical protein